MIGGLSRSAKTLVELARLAPMIPQTQSAKVLQAARTASLRDRDDVVHVPVRRGSTFESEKS
jgi:hypothetical protein